MKLLPVLLCSISLGVALPLASAAGAPAPSSGLGLIVSGATSHAKGGAAPSGDSLFLLFMGAVVLTGAWLGRCDSRSRKE